MADRLPDFPTRRWVARLIVVRGRLIKLGLHARAGEIGAQAAWLLGGGAGG